MAQQLMDRTGEPVTIVVEAGDPISAFTVHLPDASRVGRADYIDAPAPAERIFFHTEVDEAFGGRGLAGLLVREALRESIRERRVVVPVCPVFARHLQLHGAEFLADGGRFRQPTPADTSLVGRAIRDRS